MQSSNWPPFYSDSALKQQRRNCRLEFAPGRDWKQGGSHCFPALTEGLSPLMTISDSSALFAQMSLKLD